MRRSVALVLVAALGLVACGRPSGPVEVDPDLVPFDVGRTPTPTPEVSTSTITIYLVRENLVEPVERTLVTAAPDTEAAVAALLEGPTTQEQAEGFRSAIPSVARLLSVTIEDGVAFVDLAEEFQGPAPPEEVLLRIAQVVWTLVDLPGVSGVRFSIDGAPILVPTQDAPAVDRPVTGSDYLMVRRTASPVPAAPSPTVPEP